MHLPGLRSTSAVSHFGSLWRFSHLTQVPTTLKQQDFVCRWSIPKQSREVCSPAGLRGLSSPSRGSPCVLWSARVSEDPIHRHGTCPLVNRSYSRAGPWLTNTNLVHAWARAATFPDTQKGYLRAEPSPITTPASARRKRGRTGAMPRSPQASSVRRATAATPPWILILGSHVATVTKLSLTDATFPTQPQAVTERQPLLVVPRALKHQPAKRRLLPAGASPTTSPPRLPAERADRGTPNQGNPNSSAVTPSARRPRTV